MKKQLLQKVLERLNHQKVHLELCGIPNADESLIELINDIESEIAKPEQKQIGHLHVTDFSKCGDLPNGDYPIYIGNPDQSSRIAELESKLAKVLETLSDDEIEKIIFQNVSPAHWETYQDIGASHGFARAIEKAIKARVES